MTDADSVGGSLRHSKPKAQALLRQYAASLVVGDSVLVVPGWSSSLRRARHDFAAVAAGPFLETDLTVRSAQHLPTWSPQPRRDRRRQSFVGFFTSGTEGQSKGVLYEVSALLQCGHAIGTALSLTSHVTALSFVPPQFAFGLSIIHSHLLARSPVTFVQVPGPPSAFDRAISHALPDVVYMLPLQAALLASRRGRPDERRISFAVAGGRLPAATADRLAIQFPRARLFHMYGQSELGPRVALWAGNISSYTEGNVGRPITGVRVRIARGPNREPVLHVASPYRMVRYLAPHGSHDTPSAPHWWPTGDFASLSTNGDLYVVGRNTEFVKIAGVRLQLADIEKVLTAEADVIACKVHITSDPIWGDRVRARVLVGSPITHQMTDRLVPVLRRQLVDSLGSVGRLIHVEVVSHLPTNLAGKA